MTNTSARGVYMVSLSVLVLVQCSLNQYSPATAILRSQCSHHVNASTVPTAEQLQASCTSYPGLWQLSLNPTGSPLTPSHDFALYSSPGPTHFPSIAFTYATNARTQEHLSNCTRTNKKNYITKQFNTFGWFFYNN